MHLMIAAHQFIGRARLTKRDHLLTAGGVPQAPHNLLNGPGNSLSAVRFVGEPFHFLSHPQVNEGCLPQEDDMRDSLRLFRFYLLFFSEAEVILSMKNHRKRKFQDMYSSSLGSSGFFWLCCTQTLCRYMDFSHWHPAVKSLPKTFVSVCLKSRIPYNEEKIKDAKLSTELWQLQNLNV